MKRFIATAIATLSLTTTPTYANTAKAVELGIWRGMAYCTALEAGVATSEEMLDVFAYNSHPKIREGINQYSAWKKEGNQWAIDLMVKSTVEYAFDNCPAQFRHYMEEN